jgi:hypothetical protein
VVTAVLQRQLTLGLVMLLLEQETEAQETTTERRLE